MVFSFSMRELSFQSNPLAAMNSKHTTLRGDSRAGIGVMDNYRFPASSCPRKIWHVVDFHGYSRFSPPNGVVFGTSEIDKTNFNVSLYNLSCGELMKPNNSVDELCTSKIDTGVG